MLLNKAVGLGLIEEEFIKKHSNYTKDDWDKDEFWLKVKEHFQKRDEYTEQIEFLMNERVLLETSHNKRVDDYKLAALILSWTIAVPIILGITYLIDRFLITLPTIKDKKEAAESLSLAPAKTTAESELEKHGSGIARDLYYQAAKVGTTQTFFGPLKKGAEKNVEEDEGIRELLESARDPLNSDRVGTIKEIHKLYKKGIQAGGKSSIDAGQEKKQYREYMAADENDEEADTKAATAYLDLFSKPEADSELKL